MDKPVNPIIFKPDRTHVLAAAIMAGIMLLVVAAKPVILGWFLILPVAFVYWVLRSKTSVDDTGITAADAFKKQTHVPWENITGIGFRRAQAFVQTTDGTTINLPGVSFNDLPQLEEASVGSFTLKKFSYFLQVLIIQNSVRQNNTKSATFFKQRKTPINKNHFC